MQSRHRRARVRRFLGVLFLTSLTLCLWLSPSLTTRYVGSGEVVTAQTSDANQLVQQGVDRYQAGDYKGAIAAWQTALTTYQNTNNRTNEAIVLENLARAYQHLNQSERAIAYWERVAAYYRQVGDLQQVGRMLTEQAQAYSSIGQPVKAIALLCGAASKEQVCTQGSALQLAHTYRDAQGEAAALGSMGEAHRLTGKYDQAIANLQASLAIAKKINNSAYRSSGLNSLGSAYTSLAQVYYRRANSVDQAGDVAKAKELRQTGLKHDAEALKAFQASLELARHQNDTLGQMRSLLNAIPPSYHQASSSAAQVQQALSLLRRLPDSRDKVYAAIQLSRLLQPSSLTDETSSKTQCLRPELQSQATELLQQAVSVARNLQDRRAESFAVGELGHVYECRRDYQQALDLTHQAQWAADQDLLAKDSLYLWEWQAGRILKAQRQPSEAIAAYERAISTLETIRGDILVASRDLQFDFRDTVNPIYRELVALRLDQNSSPLTQVDGSEENLVAVLKTVDSLKLAELQNYFGNDCVLTAIKSERVDLVGSGTSTAVFSSIILDDRTAMILSLPNGQKRFKWIDLKRENLRKEINTFRQGLEAFYDVYDPKQAQKLYNWLIRPFADDLEQTQIRTLVFIQDGLLRSVPMAALHDGEKFLIQKYAIATTPSLTLTDPKALNRQKLRALAIGLTKSSTIDGRRFQALTNVGLEIKEVETQIPNSKQLLDDEFTRSRLQQELTKTVYPIIHIATHGEFGTEPEDTFIVTGNNEKLTLNDLDKVIRAVALGTEQVELLTLTACQTAAGDDRSALGLAGVAVQAGARSALASLWFIDDAATPKVATKFYAGLRNSNLNKAEALRVAQQSLIEAGGEYAHPAYWAPFILVGNWL